MSFDNLHGMNVARGAPSISHLLFTDDYFLFFRANVHESENMKFVLDIYSATSRQKINFDKSTICFSSNVGLSVRETVVQTLRVLGGNTVGRYLGLPSLVG